MNEKRFYKISEIAREVDLSISTLRLWERQGKINPARTASGHRVFTREDFDDIQKLRCRRLDQKESATRDAVRVDISNEG